jgi:hypothetical protein
MVMPIIFFAGRLRTASAIAIALSPGLHDGDQDDAAKVALLVLGRLRAGRGLHQ